MAFTPAFTVGQSVSAPKEVVFTDYSDGTDVAIVSHRITITDYQGNPVVPTGTTTSYITWPLATNPFTVNLLNVDTAVNTLVEWLDVDDNVLYSLSDDFCLQEINIQFFIYLIQNQGLKPRIVQGNNYFSNLCQYYINIIGAETMIIKADDLAGSQNCLSRATYMMEKQNDFF